MTITFVDSATAKGSFDGAVVTVPATVSAGDRLIALVSTNNVTSELYTPPGWVLLHNSLGMSGGGSQHAALYTKIAEGTDVGADVHFEAQPTGGKTALVLSAYAGSDTTPIPYVSDVLPLQSSGTAIPVPSVSVDELPTTLVAAASRKASTSSGVPHVWTPPAGATSRGNITETGGGAQSSAIADLAATATGATAVGDFVTDVSSGAATGFLVALKEGPPPVYNPPVFRVLTSTGWYPAP